MDAKNRPILLLISLLIVASVLLSACQPQVVVETVEVEKVVEVEKEVVKTVVVEVESGGAEPVALGGTAQVALETAKQYAGTTLNVAWEAGLQAEGLKYYAAPLWEKLTGIKINVISIPFPELYSTMMADYLAGGGSYDVMQISSGWVADFASAGAVIPLDDFMAKYYKPEDLEDLVPTFRTMMTFQGQTYGLADDGDVFTLFYRKDIFEDPANMEEFKAQYNRDLASPTTWQEWDEICSFLTAKYQPEMYGCVIQRSEGYSYFWFYDHFRVNGGKFFDDNMKAQINNEVGVQTLTEMVASNQFMPPGVEKWGFNEAMNSFYEGKTAMIVIWPPIGRWAENVGTSMEMLAWVPASQIAGKVGYGVPPGGASELAGAYQVGVSSLSKNQEAAYLFAQWLNSPEISLERVRMPVELRDPFRYSHFEDPFYKTFWGNADEYLATLKDCVEAGLNDLTILNSAEYERALDHAIQAAYAGADPKEALDVAAAEWDAITERVGVDKQKAVYEDWVESRGIHAYPAK